MFSRQQILHSIISDGQHMLEQGQVDDRYLTLTILFRDVIFCYRVSL